MHTKSTYLLYIFIGLSTFLLAEILYLEMSHTISEEAKVEKREFVKITALPDLAIVTETTAVRHRTVADLFSIYRDDPDLREYFPSTFAYSHSHIINKESKIEP
jgi:hypothetical protein